MEILVGMPVRDRIHPQTQHAIDLVRVGLRQRGIPFSIHREPRGSLPLAHSLLAQRLLDSSATHLFLIHTDISGFTAEDVLRMAGSGEDVVGGPIPGRSFEPQRIRAALVAGVPPEEAWLHAAPMLWFPYDGEPTLKNDHLFRVAAMSTGFLCISRRAVEAVAAISQRGRWGDVAFAHVFEEQFDAGGQLASEDVAFCFRAQQQGIPIWADTKIALMHWGEASFHAVPLEAKLAPRVGPRMLHAAVRFDLACPVSCELEARHVLSGAYDLPLEITAPTVLDAGANIGSFARWALVRWPGSTVTCYEPQPGPVREALAQNTVFGMRVVEKAVVPTATPGAIDFWVRDHQPTGSHTDALAPEPGERCVRVDACDAAELPNAHVVKIDIEGREPEVLERYFGGAPRTTRGLIVEWHSVADRARLRALVQARGFDVIDEAPLSPDRPEIGVLRAVRAA